VKINDNLGCFLRQYLTPLVTTIFNESKSTLTDAMDVARGDILRQYLSHIHQMHGIAMMMKLVIIDVW